MNLQNHIVWITGASSGIGREIALKLAKQGAIVALSARRKDLLDELVREIEKNGGKAGAFACDVQSETSLEVCMEEIIAAYGKLDIAIANAGFGVIGTIEKLTESEWSRQLSVNVTGLALTCKYAIPHLKKTRGRLALVGSVAAFLPNPNVGAYGASKAAVHSIGETLQLELAGSGVSCTTIHPGFVDSNIARVDNEGQYHPDKKDPRPANLMWPTDKAAQVMINAIYARKKVLVFTGHGKLLVFLGRFLPAVARRLVSKISKPK
ncbi:MAG: SDR family NAD(P)-dependent oxidoreductase [Flavobacteriales bacterium]|nr:SDR family NAD(P)-dependent oxidoreductase [Flavobacteriales bacterium]